MTKQEELEKEYSLFFVKTAKASKDFNDAVSELSPENLKRFKREMLEKLPLGYLSFLYQINK